VSRDADGTSDAAGLGADDFPTPLADVDLVSSLEDAWRLLGRVPPPGSRQELEGAWREPQRHYHDRRHLGECIALWRRWHVHADHPADVALALWFHDAVYEPRAHDNELRSAAWAARALTSAGVHEDAVHRVTDLVMATCHDAQVSGPDATLTVDIDLAILGSPAARFDTYERDVRAEYRWVPGFIYRRRRAEILQRFAERPRLYLTAPAAALLEAQARINLSTALHALAR
jgi:predicted metal-dependent HD superfamily phosphohydrolase